MSIVFAVGDALEFDSQFRGFQACISDFPANDVLPLRERSDGYASSFGRARFVSVVKNPDYAHSNSAEERISLGVLVLQFRVKICPV